jgi:anti-sigma factor RsiW
VNHRYSWHHWVDYLEGALPEQQRTEMEDHLRTCDECSHLRRSIMAMENQLQLAGKHLRDSFPVNRDRARQAAELCLQRIGGSTSAPDSCASVLERLTVLRDFMTPLCGSETVNRALGAAAQRMAVQSPEVLTEVLWPDFLENLSSITSMLCGDPTAMLVSEVGRLAS